MDHTLHRVCLANPPDIGSAASALVCTSANGLPGQVACLKPFALVQKRARVIVNGETPWGVNVEIQLHSLPFCDALQQSLFSGLRRRRRRVRRRWRHRRRRIGRSPGGSWRKRPRGRGGSSWPPSTHPPRSMKVTSCDIH